MRFVIPHIAAQRTRWPRKYLPTALCVSCACFYLSVVATAQYRFDSWTIDNGLPQGSINSILQTRDGYLWLATFGGLVRFDGLRFRVFNTGDTKGLRSGRFRGLYEDRDGNLWITTEYQGLTRYRNGIFNTYTIENGLLSNHVWRMYEDAAGNLKAETSAGLTYWDGEHFKPISRSTDEPPVWEFQHSRFGGDWFDQDGSMRKFENGRVTLDLKTGYFINAFYEDEAGRLWMGTREERLLMYQDGKLKVFSEQESYPRFPHIKFLEDRSGSLWMGTGDVGLLRFKDGKFTRYTTADGLAGNSILSIYADREGTLWVATASGLSRVTQRAITTYSTKDGLSADNVYPIYQDRQGQIWIGAWPGLTRYSDGVFSDVTREIVPPGADLKVTSLMEDREGRLWIGTWSQGIWLLKDNKVSEVKPSPNNALLVRAMIQDRSGTVWLGCSDRLIQFKDSKFIEFTTKDGLGGNEISALYEDRFGQIWIGMENGLTVFRDGKFVRYAQSDAPATIVRAIYQDADSVLWVGTYDGGLYRLKDNRFTRFTTNEGLFDNGVFSIIEDRGTDFWISCNVGIYRVRRAELNDLAEGRLKKITSVPYGKRDGMLNAECNGGGQPAGIRARDGRLWFPTQQGVAVIDTVRLPVNPQPPSVVVESAVVDTRPVDVRDGIKLQPGQVNLEINYTGLSFISPELIKFKYRLIGLDNDWVDAGTRRTAYYAHVPPGTYSFQVIAANRDGIWNEQGSTIQVMVVPPFWRTGWFISLAVLAAVLLMYLLYRRRIRQLNRAHETQAKFSHQLIASQEGERKRIAAELHDSLGQSLLLIKNFAALGLRVPDDKDRAREQLNRIEEAATESIKEVRQIAYDLRPYQLDQIGLTQALEELIDRVSGSSTIKVTSMITNVDDLYSPDKAINLYRVLQEALNNIVKHSGASEVSVTLGRKPNEVMLEIADNGKGFTLETSDGNGRGGRGFGLAGLHERARIMGGRLVIESQPAKGTKVRLTIPT